MQGLWSLKCKKLEDGFERAAGRFIKSESFYSC